MSDTNKVRLYLVAGKHIEGRESVIITGDLNVFTKENERHAKNHQREKRIKGDIVEITKEEYTKWSLSEEGKAAIEGEAKKAKSVESNRKKVSDSAVARRKASKRN